MTGHKEARADTYHKHARVHGADTQQALIPRGRILGVLATSPSYSRCPEFCLRCPSLHIALKLSKDKENL